MAQSFWSDPEYQKFKRYTAKLQKEYEKGGDSEFPEKIKNWKRGLEKMKQLATGYGMKYDKPLPLFASGDLIEKITWVKSKFKGKELIYGLWDGEDHVKIDGKHVMNKHMLSFFVEEITNKEEAKAKLYEIMVIFDAKISKVEKI